MALIDRPTYEVRSQRGRLVGVTSDPQMVAWYATCGYSTSVVANRG